ncbi:MAG: aldo/keto reductase, partial [Candidatus Latescibacteria bacterium]|nr:aldo/keto reductase [Candidatus Latescibacterota bacterium]
MIYRAFGKTGWDVSVVGLGTWNLGNQWGEMSDQEAADILIAAIDNGMNLIDTAESYGIPNGMSELRIGKAITPAMRDKLILVSKIGNWGKRTNGSVPKTSADSIRLCGHACLGRMQTDRVDVMLCHESNIKDPTVYVEGFDALREEGFVREYGISTNSLDVLKNFYETSSGVCAVVEVDYSLMNRKPEDGFLNYCHEKNLGILVRGPLAKGVLSGKYNRDSVFTDTIRGDWNAGKSDRADYEGMLGRLEGIRDAVGDDSKLVETALRYVISHKSNPVVIPGATKVAQVASNAEAGAALLDDALYQKLS